MIAKKLLVAILLHTAASSYVKIDIEQGNMDDNLNFHKRGEEPPDFKYKPPHRKRFVGLSPDNRLAARSVAENNNTNEITLYNNKNYRYYAVIGLGTPAQNITVIVDTGSSDLFVYSPKNPFCKADHAKRNLEAPSKTSSKRTGKKKMDRSIRKRLNFGAALWGPRLEASVTATPGNDALSTSQTSSGVRPGTHQVSAFEETSTDDDSIYATAKTSYSVIRPVISATAAANPSDAESTDSGYESSNSEDESSDSEDQSSDSEDESSGSDNSDSDSSDSEDESPDSEDESSDSDNSDSDSSDSGDESSDSGTSESGDESSNSDSSENSDSNSSASSDIESTDSGDDTSDSGEVIPDNDEVSTTTSASSVSKSKETSVLKEASNDYSDSSDDTYNSLEDSESNDERTDSKNDNGTTDSGNQSETTATSTVAHDQSSPSTASYNSADEFLSTFRIPASISAYTFTSVPSPTATMSCESFQFYDNSSSNSAKSLNSKFLNWYYADEFAYGDVMNDTLAIGNYSIDNYTFGVATSGNSSESILGIGLGSNENIGYTYNNLIYRLADQGDIQRRVYSLYLNQENASQGSLLLGAIDTEKFEGNLTLLPLVDLFNFYVTTTGASLVSTGNDLATNSKVSVVSNVKHAAIFDTGSPALGLPRIMLRNVIGSIPGATFIESAGTIIGKCSSFENIALNINFGGQPFSIDLDSMTWPLSSYQGFYLTDLPPVLNSTEYCMLPFTNSDSDEIILGDPIMRQMYVFYDLEYFRLGVAKAKYGSNSSNIIPVVDVDPSNSVKAPLYEDIYENVATDQSLNLTVNSGYSKLGLNISKDYDTIIALVGEDTSSPGYWKVGAVFAAVALGDLIIVLIMMM